MTTKKRYLATRGVSWRDGDTEINREAGDDISDAPADVIKEWRGLEPPAAVNADDWPAHQAPIAAQEAADALRELAAKTKPKEATDGPTG